MMLSLCLCVTALLLQPGYTYLYNCSSTYNRVPGNQDLTVDCGPSTITLEVNLCTAQWAGFDPTTLALNGEHNSSECQGTVDATTDPPVVRFLLPVNDSQANLCRQSLQIVDEVLPSGIFSIFSSIQSVVINGFIDTPSSSDSIISYSTDLFYQFSCRYPLEYFLNNTPIVASSVSLATSDNNGTFISTLRMSVYNDTNFTMPLVVPDAGLPLRTKVYVKVKATNLTGNFFVLLDMCFATPSPFNLSNLEKHSFFIGCVVDERTVVDENGVSQESRFSFEAFRFVEHRDRNKSSLYLHCILRLCEPNTCQEILNSCSGNVRRRRAADPFGSTSSGSTEVSLGPIYTAGYDAVDQPVSSALGSASKPMEAKISSSGLVAAVIFASAGGVLSVLMGWFVLKTFCYGGRLAKNFK
ncbi:zona pellucida-like domain-containing protein 1 [Arapaima gigas]